MALCKKVLSRASIVELSRDIILSKLKDKLFKHTGKNIFLSLYISYNDIIKIIVMKILSYVSNSKVLTMILVALL